MIRVGTSGFKFDDWKGAFYPPKLPSKDWLKYYAEKFDCLEVNSTYYRLMPPATFYHMAQKVPANFLFTVKAYRTLTHEIGAQTEADLPVFVDSLRPLLEAEKFGCVLAQFPSAFHNTPEHLDYIAGFQEKLVGLPLVVEFRHRGWLEEETFGWLKQRKIGFCGVDEPQFASLMPPVARATSNIGYLRFHGRNYQHWWGGNKDLRYDYLYSEAELQPWLPKIHQLESESEITFVFMNNCHLGQAAVNAEQLRKLLEVQG